MADVTDDWKDSVTIHDVRNILLVVAVVVIVGFLWFRGTFDDVLVNVGLNAQPCVHMLGETFCGDEAKVLCHVYIPGVECDEGLVQ